jgi:NADPH:quinone reductase-like Zn-dependent oxidoreductase
MAGIVEKAGTDVYDFKPGDRVAGFHVMQAPGGSYAEYGVCPAHTVWHIPKNISFEEAAAIPLASLTAAVGLYSHTRLGLPHPWTPASDPIPLIVYGAASAVGAYAIHLAKRSNIHPIICVAGNSADFVETLIDRSKGDSVVDYRKGDDAVVEGLKKALNGRPAYHAFDAVSEKGSHTNLVKVLEPKGSKITFVLPVDKKDIPDGIQPSQTMVGDVHKDEAGKELGYVMTRYIARGLQQGWFKPQKQVVVPGGLNGVQGALDNLHAGKANAVKYVFRIDETEGVSR